MAELLLPSLGADMTAGTLERVFKVRFVERVFVT